MPIQMATTVSMNAICHQVRSRERLVDRPELSSTCQTSIGMVPADWVTGWELRRLPYEV